MFKKGKRLAALCTIIFVVLSMCMPCLADETQKTIRVGSFEDTFNYVDEHGARRGYGYELMQALAGYTGMLQQEMIILSFTAQLKATVVRTAYTLYHIPNQ